MKKLTMFLIAFVLCGLMTNAQVVFNQPNKIFYADASVNFGAYPENAHQQSLVVFGNFNNDNYSDMVIIDHLHQNSNSVAVGKLFLYYGSSQGYNVNSPIEIENTIQVNGNGITSLNVGDFNNDGYDDLVFGAEADDVNTGLGWVVVYFSNSNGSGLDLSNKLEIYGSSVNNKFGENIKTGDFNGDGIDDFVVSAPYEPYSPWNGKLYVFYGKTTFTATPDKILYLDNSLMQDLRNVGDINGDGYTDIITYDIPSWSHAEGRMHIYFGGSDMAVQPAITISMPYDHGIKCGDLNNDGFDDIIIGFNNSPNIKIIKGAATFDVNDQIEIQNIGDLPVFSTIIDVNNDNIKDAFISVTKNNERLSFVLSGHQTSFINTVDTLYKFVDSDASLDKQVNYVRVADANGDGSFEFYANSKMDIYGSVVFQYDNSVTSNFIISTSNQNATVGRTIEIPVLTSELVSGDNVIAYQFDFNYDNTKLEYVGNTLAGTLAVGGSLQVNPTTNKLSFAWARGTALVGTGEILKLQFKVLAVGETTPTITNALYNTESVTATNGTITAVYKYGDIDANDFVQAYDAALAIQYSVGLDPLPTIDPLPWENWRVIVADVDGTAGVTANDASEILKYTVGLISTFPVESGKKSGKSETADVNITLVGNELLFQPTGELFGLNVNATENISVLGQPQFLNANMLNATNINANTYSIGLATATAPTENETFMKIPVTLTQGTNITFDLIINTTVKSVTVSGTTGIVTINDKAVSVYPNPTNSILYVNGMQNANIQIFDLTGKMIINLQNTDNQINVSNLQNGIYTVKITNENGTTTRKFVKQ